MRISANIYYCKFTVLLKDFSLTLTDSMLLLCFCMNVQRWEVSFTRVLPWRNKQLQDTLPFLYILISHGSNEEIPGSPECEMQD